MKTHLAGAAVLLLGAAGAIAQTHPSTRPTGAAVRYLELLAPVLADDKHPLREDALYPYDSLTEKTAHILKANTPLLDAWRDTGALPAATWAPPQSQAELMTLTKRFGIARTVSQTLLTRARWHAESQRPAEAVRDLVGVFTLSRHVQQQPLLISRIVGSSMEDSAQSIAAHLLSRLPPDEVATLEKQLQQMPAIPSFNSVLKGEMEFGNLLAGEEGIPDEMVKSLAEFYGLLLESKAATPDELDAQIKAAIAKLPEEKRVMAETIVPPISTARRSLAAHEARIAMFQSAMQIRIQGDDALKQSRDPFGNGPFTRIAKPDGYELHSELMRSNRQPVVLEVISTIAP